METASFSDSAPTYEPAPAPQPRTPTTQEQVDDYDFLYAMSPQGIDEEEGARLLRDGRSESILEPGEFMSTASEQL